MEPLYGHLHLHAEQGKGFATWYVRYKPRDSKIARGYSPAAKLDLANELAASALAAY